MWGKLIEIWLPGERRQPWRPQSVRIAQLICNLLELRLTRIKLEGLVWQGRLQCRLSKPSIILSIFLSRAAAVKLLLTLQLSLAPCWAHQQMFQSHLQITVETAFFAAMSHNSEGSGKNAIKLYQLSWDNKLTWKNSEVRHYCLKQQFQVPF